MLQYDHEEADSRMCVHLRDAMDKNGRNILVCTVDNDVIVILIGLLYPVHPGMPLVWAILPKHQQQHNMQEPWTGEVQNSEVNNV